jgi:hypothetical protein
MDLWKWGGGGGGGGGRESDEFVRGKEPSASAAAVAAKGPAIIGEQHQIWEPSRNMIFPASPFQPPPNPKCTFGVL